MCLIDRFVAVGALVFGPSKLPELGKQLGTTAKSLGAAVKEFNEVRTPTTKQQNNSTTTPVNQSLTINPSRLKYVD